MSFTPWCGVGSPPSAGDSGRETFVGRCWKKESERKTSWEIVSLRVPGTVDNHKSSSAPDVIRICQEPRAQKKPRKKFNPFGFVIVPESPDFDAPEKRQQSSETSASSSVPSIKRKQTLSEQMQCFREERLNAAGCSLDEIEAVKRPLEKNLKGRKGTEKGRKRMQRSGERYKTPARHPAAPRTRVRMGSAT